MQIAYLILAHNNYTHLQRLINALTTPYSRFYVHIDRKSPMPVIKDDNVLFIKNRVKVTWSSFSEVQATLNLLDAAIKDNNDYFVLLSGVDYPIRCNEEIKNRLSQGYEFIHILEQSQHSSHPVSYFKYYYFSKFYGKSKGLNYLIFRSIEKLLRKARIQKQIPFRLFVGGQWFALTRNCIKHILKELDQNKRYKKFFKFCRFPSESFFLTIIGNSEYFKNSAHYLTYIDWRNHTPPIINESHISIIKNTPYLFARKFDDNASDIVHLIDRDLRGIENRVKQ